jgi:hypothetical protein
MVSLDVLSGDGHGLPHAWISCESASNGRQGTEVMGIASKERPEGWKK